MKVGDFGYHDFKLGQVMAVENGRVTEFSTGYIRTSGADLSFVPLSLRALRVADEFATISRAIHDKGHAGLNYPDIHRWLVRKWLDTQALDENDASVWRALWDELAVFKNRMVGENPDSGYGFPLLRRRAA